MEINIKTKYDEYSCFIEKHNPFGIWTFSGVFIDRDGFYNYMMTPFFNPKADPISFSEEELDKMERIEMGDLTAAFREFGRKIRELAK